MEIRFKINPDIQDGLSLKRELTPDECRHIIDDIFWGDSNNSDTYDHEEHSSAKDKELCENVTDIINGRDLDNFIHNVYDVGCCDNPIVSVLELIKYLMSINAL